MEIPHTRSCDSLAYDDKAVGVGPHGRGCRRRSREASLELPCFTAHTFSHSWNILSVVTRGGNHCKGACAVPWRILLSVRLPISASFYELLRGMSN